MKITEDLLTKMKTAREEGATYSEIMRKFGVSKWSCMKYLRDIKSTKFVSEERWIVAENKAEAYLKEKGFEHIINLNNLGNSPFFDYYAERDGEKWLFDVTIDEGKALLAKALRMPKKHRVGILYATNDSFKCFEVVLRNL